MLLAVKNYLVEKRIANLEQMALHFNQDPDYMKSLLAHWIRKGKVRRLDKPSGCGTRCVQCKPETAEVYCWCEAQQLNAIKVVTE